MREVLLSLAKELRASANRMEKQIKAIPIKEVHWFPGRAESLKAEEALSKAATELNKALAAIRKAEMLDLRLAGTKKKTSRQPNNQVPTPDPLIPAGRVSPRHPAGQSIAARRQRPPPPA